jgi:hypothetical protein
MQLVTIFTTLNLAEADLVRSQLDAAGFDVALPDEFSAMSLGSAGAQTSISTEHTTGKQSGSGGIRVQVPEDQAVDARALLDATINSKDEPPGE